MIPLQPTFIAAAGAAVLSALITGSIIASHYGGKLDKASQALAVATSERDNARSAAQECSEATDALKKLADQRAKEADAARAQARKASATRAKRADAILAAPPAVPGDDCASARVRVDGWLKGRAAP